MRRLSDVSCFLNSNLVVFVNTPYIASTYFRGYEPYKNRFNAAWLFFFTSLIPQVAAFIENMIWKHWKHI